MLLAANHPRRQNFYSPHYTPTINIPQQTHTTQQQIWSSIPTIPSPPHSDYNDTTASNSIFTFGTDPTLFDYQPATFSSSSSQSLMQSEQPNSWLSTGQLTPNSTTRTRHHRESSLSSLGSAGPASPYTANTSNPQVAGELYHDFHDFAEQPASKPLTPAHTPSQEQFLAPNYTNFYHSNHIPFGSVGNDGLPGIKMGNAADFNGHSARPSNRSVASHESPSTPPAYEVEERQKRAYRSDMPKLDRTMTDIYADELYNPSFQFTSAPSTSTAAIPATVSPVNDIFAQRLQAANSQHLSVSNPQVPLTIPSRDRSPFRQGSPLAPTANGFGQQSPNFKFGTATHMREQQKAENDARALREQMERTAPEENTPNTISPKDVDLVYHENEEDSSMPLFPPQQQRSPAQYRQPPTFKQETTEADDTASLQSYGSMATTRRESSSAYSTTSQATPQQSSFNFVPPSVPGSVRQIPQQYPFVPQARRQPSNLSNVTEDFPASLTSMESSSSDYAPDQNSESRKPAGASADTGTYTCTYHGCTLRFETPSKLQRHKREGHRSSASAGDSGMTSAALNTQNGPHKCERINPSTGKPCNTIFSRPYDLTRHEDTIHNARKQKVRCHLCTEEKTFSRNDALTRHFRVCHPDHLELTKARRRNARD